MSLTPLDYSLAKATPAHRSMASYDWYSLGVTDTEAAHGITKGSE